VTRVDLHLHSRASTDTASWFLRRAVLPESYTPPEVAYRTAKARGMDFVTLSDHNTIDGALEIAHHPDAFVSVEVTTRFPDDGVPLHVLVWDLDEAAWDEIDRLRPNVLELVDHLEASGLAFALAHPLQRVGPELTVDHIERCLLLFRRWEGRNGARVQAGNEAARRLARSATPEYLAKLAEKHGIAPRGDGPRALVGGSDDHGLLDVAATYTLTPPASSVAELIDHLRAGRCEPGGAHGSTVTLAHSLTSLVAKEYAERGAPGLPVPLHGVFADLIGHGITRPDAPPEAAARRGARSLIRRVRANRTRIRAFREASRGPESAQRSHRRLHVALSWVQSELVDRGLRRDTPAGTGVSDRMGSLVGAGLLSLPYAAAAAYHAGEARFASRMEEAFFGIEMPGDRRPRVAMFTDTLGQVNGAAGTIRRLADHVAAHDAPAIVVTAEHAPVPHPAVVNLQPQVRVPIPGYPDPSWRLGIPSPIEAIQLVERRGIDVIHAATPGPMGIIGLLLARSMGLDFVATYHTELARYALELTGDRLAAEAVRTGVGWFYRQAARVNSPSAAADEALVDLGVEPDRIVRFTRGIDVRRFAPRYRSEAWRARIGGSTHILFVGRISREKGVFALADAFRRVAASRPDLRLVVVGDGPARAELERELAGHAVAFTGVLAGDELATAYASADVFCLPSGTETFGQVVLEASASGLPVVTVAGGAAGELVRPDVSGVVLPGRDPVGLAQALARLADDEPLRERMGAAGRIGALDWPTWDEIFDDLLAGYADLGGPGRDTSIPALAWEPLA